EALQRSSAHDQVAQNQRSVVRGPQPAGAAKSVTSRGRAEGRGKNASHAVLESSRLEWRQVRTAEDVELRAFREQAHHPGKESGRDRNVVIEEEDNLAARAIERGVAGRARLPF